MHSLHMRYSYLKLLETVEKSFRFGGCDSGEKSWIKDETIRCRVLLSVLTITIIIVFAAVVRVLVVASIPFGIVNRCGFVDLVKASRGKSNVIDDSGPPTKLGPNDNEGWPSGQYRLKMA